MTKTQAIKSALYKSNVDQLKAVWKVELIGKIKGMKKKIREYKMGAITAIFTTTQEDSENQGYNSALIDIITLLLKND